MTHKLIKTDNYLLVVDDSKIRDVRPFKDRWHLEDGRILNMFPDYLTDLSVCKLIIAHLPLNGSPLLEGVDLLPPYSRHQEDGVDELAEMNYPMCEWAEEQCLVRRLAFMNGYNKAREKYKYTEEDMLEFANWCRIHDKKHPNEVWMIGQLLTKYESIHQYPTVFEKEDVLTPSQIFYPNDVPYSSPKTITTAQGVQWVGKYK
jgi:hypothetical protein